VTTYRIKKLAELVDGWRKVSQVRDVVQELTESVLKGKEPFLGKPLPRELVHGRFPPGIESAWVFVLKPKTRTPAHRHPNSVQHMAVIDGGGLYFIGGRSDYLQPFDPAFPIKSIYVIPQNTPHAFEPGHEPLVVMSFHTVSAESLIEEEVESERVRTCEHRPSPPRSPRGPREKKVARDRRSRPPGGRDRRR
jgi:quercetin dioxygenase-like cupin family protein